MRTTRSVEFFNTVSGKWRPAINSAAACSLSGTSLSDEDSPESVRTVHKAQDNVEQENKT